MKDEGNILLALYRELSPDEKRTWMNNKVSCVVPGAIALDP